jgi:hypothetical protein
MGKCPPHLHFLCERLSGWQSPGFSSQSEQQRNNHTHESGSCAQTGVITASGFCQLVSLPPKGDWEEGWTVSECLWVCVEPRPCQCYTCVPRHTGIQTCAHMHGCGCVYMATHTRMQAQVHMPVFPCPQRRPSGITHCNDFLLAVFFPSSACAVPSPSPPPVTVTSAACFVGS